MKKFARRKFQKIFFEVTFFSFENLPSFYMMTFTFKHCFHVYYYQGALDWTTSTRLSTRRTFQFQSSGFTLSHHIPISCHDLLSIHNQHAEQGLWQLHWFEIQKFVVQSKAPYCHYSCHLVTENSLLVGNFDVFMSRLLLVKNVGQGQIIQILVSTL